jgi:cytochrome c556
MAVLQGGQSMPALIRKRQRELMMRRVLLTVSAAVILVTGAYAQSDVLPSTALMGQQAQAMYGDLNGMVKGEAPYDKAKADAAIAKLKETAARIPAAFPERSKGKKSPNSRYTASPKVWETPDDFKAKVAAFSKAVDDNAAKVDTLDGLKAAYPTINGACNGCHDVYRVRSN